MAGGCPAGARAGSAAPAALGRLCRVVFTRHKVPVAVRRVTVWEPRWDNGDTRRGHDGGGCGRSLKIDAVPPYAACTEMHYCRA